MSEDAYRNLIRLQQAILNVRDLNYQATPQQSFIDFILKHLTALEEAERFKVEMRNSWQPKRIDQ